jgi:hypothetical protein
VAAVPVIDFAEPPLHAEIMISSSMTESLILLLLAVVRPWRKDQPLASALDNEDILVAN